MVKAQEWLESQEQYNTKEKREKVKELDLSNKNLSDDLDLVGFTSLKEINITGNPQLGKITNKGEKLKIIITNPQELLDREYPINGVCNGEFDQENKGKKRENIFKLNHTSKGLKGELNLEGFTDLRVLECDRNELTNLDISICPKLEVLNCGLNKLINLDLSKNKNLIEVGCWINELRELDISKCPNLKKLGCSKNQITKLDFSNNPQLKSSDIADNQLAKQDLSFLAHLTNLQTLIVGNSSSRKFFSSQGNQFVGDLKHLSDMKKLRWLSFDNTNIEDNFDNLKENGTLSKEISKVNFKFTWRPNAYELNPSNIGVYIKEVGIFNLADAVNTFKLLMMFSEEVRDYKIEVAEVIERAEEGVEVKKASEIPNIVLSNLRDRELKEEKEEESHEIWNRSYNKVYPDNLIKKKINDRVLKPNELPKRLYNVKGKEIIESKEKVNYATLSYVWNDWIEKSTEKIGDKEFELSASSKKSLAKATETCNYLEIEYLWVDQLCINQDNLEEKAKEVRNMYQNYNNSAVTLVSINKNIQRGDNKEWDNDSLKVLEEIVNSQWFSRSWTFQEGWLSRHTIFMFDDMLIDGAFLAKVWAFNQSADAEGKYISRQEFEEEEKKIATPIGWVRYEHGYKTGNEGKGEDRLTFSLHEALRGVKERRRGVPLDGIYSVLGLLPYGHEVEVEYKKWGEEYTKEDAEKALINVMKAAIEYKDKEGQEHGYGEPLAWYGPNKGTGKSWLPEIKMDYDDKSRNGSVEVWGGINIKYKPRSIYFDDTGAIALSAKMYSISSDKNEDMVGVGGKSVSGGIYSRKIRINEDVSIKIWGTKETLRYVIEEGDNKDNRLIIPDEAKGDTPFALLISREGTGYRRIGLVGLEEKDEKEIKRIETESKIIVIDFDEKGSKSCANIEEGYKAMKAQIQITPKSKLIIFS